MSAVIFCVAFNLLISSSGSFIFCCCLSSLVLLVLEKVSYRIFRCFWCFLVGFIDWSLSCMFILGLVLLSKLVVKLCLLEGLRPFLNISAYVDFSVFSVSSIVAVLFALLVDISSCSTFRIFVDV